MRAIEKVILIVGAVTFLLVALALIFDPLAPQAPPPDYFIRVGR